MLRWSAVYALFQTFKIHLLFNPSLIFDHAIVIFNNYSPKARWILSTNYQSQYRPEHHFIRLNFKLSLDFEDDIRSECWNVSHSQQAFSGLLSLRPSNSIQGTNEQYENVTEKITNESISNTESYWGTCGQISPVWALYCDDTSEIWAKTSHIPEQAFGLLHRDRKVIEKVLSRRTYLTNFSLVTKLRSMHIP